MSGSSIKPCFMQPVEIVDGVNDIIKFDVSGGSGWQTLTLNKGVYASVASVLKHIEDQCPSGDSLNIDTSIEKDSDNLHFQAKFTDVVNFKIDFHTLALAQLLGCGTDNDAGYPGTFVTDDYATSHTMQYRPQKCWIPRYQRATQDRWHIVPRDQFSGIEGKTGIVTGMKTGPTIYRTDLRFVNEDAVNLFTNAATVLDHNTRNAEYFFTDCRTSHPVVASEPSTKGFWYVQDWTEITDGNIPGGSSGDTTSNIGVNFDLAASPDLWAFAQIDKDGPSIPAPSVPTGLDYYEISLSVHTVETVPTWEDPTP